MFGANLYLPVVVSLDYDPAADDDVIVYKAPFGCEIASAYITTANAVGADTANYFDLALYNNGTAGTAISNAISGTVGGTAGFVALSPVAFTISDGVLDAGECVMLRYNEAGTGSFAQMTLQLNILPGQ